MSMLVSDRGSIIVKKIQRQKVGGIPEEGGPRSK